MSDISNIYSNILTSSKKKKLIYLNNLHNDIHYKLHNNNIQKIFLLKKTFDWEMYILIMLKKLNLDITPNIIHINYKNDNDNNNINNFSNITYETHNLISLRKLFETKNNFHYIINELISFLKTFKNKNILIGNLHIDTIYVNKNLMKFYLLDISNTIFIKNSVSDKDLDIQSLYMSLYDNTYNKRINHQIINYFNKQMSAKKTLSKYTYIDNILDIYTN